MNPFSFLLGLPALVFSLLLLTSCRDRVNQNVNMTVASEAADGLDLKAVTALLKEVKTPEELEKKINSGEPRISNLDLNEDGTIDYIKVTEYAAGEVRGFSLTTELEPGEVQELATIEITKDEKGGHQVQTHGNRQIYGNNHYYHGGFGVGDFLLLNYLYSSYRPYSSRWGHGNYPDNYRRSAPLDSSRYRGNMSGFDSSTVRSAKTPAFQGSGASPNRSKTSSKIKAPLRNPTASQRSFQARNPSKSLRRGGFGSGSRPGSFRNSSSSRSRSSFGGGK